MKKRYLYFLLFGLSFSNSGCQKWLDVQPRTEASRDDLLSTEVGYRDALTGVYLNMKKEDTYGKNLTFGYIEDMVSSWDTSPKTASDGFSHFDYGDAMVEEAIATIYRQQYATVARINSILDKIDAHKSAFVTPGSYEIVKGESLALRAYVHLDLLRLFGPHPDESSTEKILPYVKNLSNSAQSFVTVEEYRKALYEDLAHAASLLKDVDPILKYSNEELATPDAGDPELWIGNAYFTNRNLRMNYYAVKALEARTYLWFKDKEKAFLVAKEVIAAKNKDGSSKFVLGGSTDMSSSNFNLPKEHIFGLYDYQLAKKYKDNFTDGKLKKGENEVKVKNELYGNTGKDIRESHLWSQIELANKSMAYVIKKYRAAENFSVPGPFQIPLLRLSELYFIAVECAPQAESKVYWDEFVSSRNTNENVYPSSTPLLYDALIKEYRKEFFAEGQAFYAYKRFNVGKSSFLWLPAGANIVYRVPVPKAEFAE